LRRNVLIIGSTGLLGTYLTAFRLTSSEDIIFHAVSQAEATFSNEAMSLLLQAAQQIAPEKACSVEGRLHRMPCDFGSEAPDAFSSGARIDEAWFLSEGFHSGKNGNFAIGSLLSALPQLGVTEFNCVGTGGIADMEREVIEQCNASGISYRIFSTGLIISENLPLRDHKREGVFRLLSALYDIKNEIEEHLPEYFEYQALRCWAPDDAGISLIRADQAAEIMSRIAQRPDTFANRYDVVSPESVSFADLCERIGMVYGLSLLTVDDRQSLNVIDRLFHERLNRFHAHFIPSGEFACEETYRAAGFASEDVLLDEEAQVALFEAILCNQNAVRDVRRERIAGFPGSLEQKTINRGEFELTYYSGGSGEIPIILLNALGQGLSYWYRLIDNLIQRHRVIIWEPRGTVFPPPPFGIKDQVDDLEAVLENEAADTCYLIGWCTGPKVATEFYLRHPSAVLAMVFLNSTFRCLGGPEEYETDYEHNLEPLCRMLNRRPETAASVMKSLQASNSGDHINLLEESDPEQLAAGVLSLINVDLKHEVLMPFRNETTMLNYSHQVLDFWSCNTLEHAPRVQIPVLVIGSEYDKNASPAMSRLAAELFPTARYVQLQGATHYCFYDRPDLITDLIERFFHDPDALSGIDSEAKLIRHENGVSCQSEYNLTSN
jgi:pimeloyl-ACP methyl ester carboxylesterase